MFTRLAIPSRGRFKVSVIAGKLDRGQVVGWDPAQIAMADNLSALLTGTLNRTPVLVCLLQFDSRQYYH